MDLSSKISYFEEIDKKIRNTSVEEIESEFVSYLSGEKKDNIFGRASFPIDIEMIISYFEFLLDLKQKNENGIVFTPKYVSDFIVKQALDHIDTYSEELTIIDPGCGCGIFLISAIEYLNKRFSVPISQIINKNIYGIDIIPENVRRCKFVLEYYAKLKGDTCVVHPHIFNADSLKTDWNILLDVKRIDYVIGNPPYVNTHDMSKDTIAFLKSSFSTTTSGVFNIFYAFIEHSLKQIESNGFINFIVPNNFLSIKSAENLRQLLQSKGYIDTVIDFANNMIFKPVRTYNCIIQASKAATETMQYCVLADTDDIEKSLAAIEYSSIAISELDKNGWNLVDPKTLRNLKKIEGQMVPIKDFIRTGIATLRDNIYLVSKDDAGFYKKTSGKRFDIEEGIVKPIYKIPELKNCTSPKDVMQYIIFPYVKGKNGFELIDETMFSTQYPNAYQYLTVMRHELDSRDKGKPSVANWYAYGRTQGLNKYGKKLLFPTFASNPNFIYIDDDCALFCNGYAVFENDIFELDILEKILNSAIMQYYVSNTSYSIEGGYYCYQKKYIERFSIPILSEEECAFIISGNKNDVDRFLIKKYDLAM